MAARARMGIGAKWRYSDKKMLAPTMTTLLCQLRLSRYGRTSSQKLASKIPTEDASAPSIPTCTQRVELISSKPAVTPQTMAQAGMEAASRVTIAPRQERKSHPAAVQNANRFVPGVIRDRL